MDFIKKHYEKVILSLVLLGVVGALVALPFVIAKDKEEMDAMQDIIAPKPKPLDPLDLSRQNAVLARVKAPYVLDFETTNKIVNPVLWKKNPASGELFKIMTGHEIDAEAAVVTKITPLYFILSLEDIKTNTGVIYVIMVERQAARAGQQKHPHFAAKGEKNADFTITGVKGDPMAPDELELKLADSGETVAVAPHRPYRRADAYTADLKFDPENKKFTGRRVGSHLAFGSDEYNIVAINENEVILAAQSNQKKTILHYQR
jgi:hypothetical protein